MNYSPIDLTIEEKIEFISELIEEQVEAGQEASEELYDLHAHLVGITLGIDWDSVDLNKE